MAIDSRGHSILGRPAWQGETMWGQLFPPNQPGFFLRFCRLNPVVVAVVVAWIPVSVTETQQKIHNIHIITNKYMLTV